MTIPDPISAVVLGQAIHSLERTDDLLASHGNDPNFIGWTVILKDKSSLRFQAKVPSVVIKELAGEQFFAFVAREDHATAYVLCAQVLAVIRTEYFRGFDDHTESQ